MFEFLKTVSRLMNIARGHSMWGQHCTFETRGISRDPSVSVYVHILANNALRAHHARAYGGVSTNGLSDICLICFNDSTELLEILFDGRAFHSLP